ncbi:MAG: isocitrate lyase/phosphoenolpyruvate mutase family protein [Myxococcota bacterium]
MPTVRPSSAAAREAFRALHETPFVLPNPWDRGSARILARMGFAALATTSAGFANALGRPDGGITRDEAIGHAAEIVAATPLPVSADLENGFGDAPEDAATTIRAALGAGLAGASIEDWSGETLYDAAHGADRIRAAVEANRADAAPLVLTARAENHIRGNPDLADTIARLQAYQEAGADVLYAPGLASLDDIRSLLAAVDRPINCLILPGGPSAKEMMAAGAARISTGSAIAAAAQATIVDAARELLDQGTHGFWANALPHLGTVAAAMATED